MWSKNLPRQTRSWCCSVLTLNRNVSISLEVYGSHWKRSFADMKWDGSSDWSLFSRLVIIGVREQDAVHSPAQWVPTVTDNYDRYAKSQWWGLPGSFKCQKSGIRECLSTRNTVDCQLHFWGQSGTSPQLWALIQRQGTSCRSLSICKVVLEIAGPDPFWQWAVCFRLSCDRETA